MYPLRFQVQISRIQRQTNSQVHVFSDVGDWSKNYLQVNKSNIQLFSYLLVLGNRTRDSSAQKINEITIKVRGKFIYLFIYLFIYNLFIYLYYSF